MLKVFTLLILCLWVSQGDTHRRVIFQPVDDCETANEYQLCQDFRDIRNLIDANTLVYYISYGYYKDEKFRKAMDFIKTDQFQSVSQQLADSAAYQKLMTRFSDAGVTTETIASISNIFNCLMISIPEYGDDSEITELEMQSIVVPRTLQDVALNLVNAIPRSKLRSLIRSKLHNNNEFANFYRVLRSAGFRRDVKKLLSSYQSRYPINVLKRHNIDLSKLLQYVNKIFDYGPNY